MAQLLRLLVHNRDPLNHGKEIQAKSQSPISERDDQDERQGFPVAQVGGSSSHNQQRIMNDVRVHRGELLAS